MKKLLTLWTFWILVSVSQLMAQSSFKVQGRPHPGPKNPIGQSVKKTRVSPKDAIDPLDYSSFTFDSIKFWVGEGENRAALVVDWYDDKGPTMVWGFRWHKDSTATGETLLRAVAAADPKFSVLIMGGTQYGSAIGGIGYDQLAVGQMCLKYGDNPDEVRCPDEQGVLYTDSYDFDEFNYPVNANFRWFSAWTNFGYWSYQLKSEGETSFTYAPVGATSRVLSDGDWDAWGAQIGWDSWEGVPPRMPFVAAIPPVSGVSLDHQKIGIRPSETAQLTAVVLPIHAENRNVSWISREPAIAEVDQNGLVTAMSEGEVYIVVTTEEGSFTDSCKVNVKTPLPFPDYDAYWPTVRKDTLSHMPIVSTPLAIESDSLVEKWKTSLGGGFSSSGQPLIVNDRIYIAAQGKIKMFNKETGELIKEAALGGSIGFFSFMAYGEGKIFIPLGSGVLKAFRADNLEQIWQTEALSGKQQLCEVTYHNGYVYTGMQVGSGNSTGTFYCVKAEDEDPFSTDEIKPRLWESFDKSYYWSGGTIVDDAVVFGGDLGALESRHHITGALIDSIQTSGNIRCGTSYDKNSRRIFFTNKTEKRVYSVKVNNNGTFDRSSLKYGATNGEATTVPVLYNNRLYVSVGSMTSGGGLDVIDANSLEIIYSAATGISQATPLISTGYATEDNNHTIYIYITTNTSKGNIVCLKDFDGNTDPIIQYTYTPSTEQYCTHSLLTDENGVMYYKNDGGFLIAYTNKPTPPRVESVTLSHHNHNLYQGENFQLQATVFPSNAQNKTITWNSCDTTIAKVNQEGLVTAGGNTGSAYIYVTTDDGAFSDTCTVQVLHLPLTSITLEKQSDTFYIGVKEHLLVQITPVATPADSLVWQSSDPAVATVDSTGLLTAVALGHATVFVSNKARTLVDSCTVFVDEVDYTKGVFFVNEDWFGHTNGSVNFLTENGKFIYRAYTRENPGETFGATTQFGTIYGDNFYFISKQASDGGDPVQGGGRLVVADAKTLKKKAAFDEIGSGDGRSFLGVTDKKGYIGTSSGIYLFDIDSLKIGALLDSTGGGGLYAGQIGTMLRIGQYVFASKQSSGILVFDADTDTFVKHIACEKIGTIVQSLDGFLWATAHTDGLWKINPHTLEIEEKRAIPEHAQIPGSWGAWTSSLICASHQTNTLYWAKMNGSAQMTFFGTKVFRYDIDNPDLDTAFYELTRNNEAFYGSAINMDPVKNQLVITTTQSGYGSNYENNWVHFVDASTGALADIKTLDKYYWFPSMSVFPDNYAPLISNEIETLHEINTDETIVIHLAGKVSDPDNFDPAIHKAVAHIDGADVADAYISKDSLFIKPLKEGTATLALICNSNGKLASETIEVRVSSTGSNINILKPSEISFYPNPVTSFVNVSTNMGDRIMMFNMMGQKVFEAISSSSTTQIDMSDMTKGTYLLYVNKQSVKVIKQ